MSTITGPYPTRSVLKDLVYSDTLPDVPFMTLWWRQRLVIDRGGNLYAMELDDPEKPTEFTVTWQDGGFEDTVRPYAVRLGEDRSEDWPSEKYLARVAPPPRQYLDVLWYEPPTAGLWWPLTDPGQHVHPEDRKEILEFRKEWWLATLTRMTF